jgi:hypothetical protein
MVVSSLFFLKKKKKKEAPNPNVKILFPEGQISIYIVVQKSRTDYFISNDSFNANVSYEKNNSTPNCMPNKFFY